MNHFPILIAGAANTVSHSCVWIQSKTHKQSFIAFALHNTVAIINVSQNRIVCTLKGCNNKINAICYNNSLSGDFVEVFVAADDSSIQVWRHSFKEDLTEWTQTNSLPGMKSSLTTIYSLTIGSSSVVAASDSSGLLNVWRRSDNQEYSLVESLLLPPAQMAYTLCLVALPGNSAIAMFVGNVDARIHVYIANQLGLADKQHNGAGSSRLFKNVGVLSGHEEWVTCLSATVLDDKTIMLASGSQDSKIRIWKIKPQQGLNKNVSSETDVDDPLAELDEKEDEEEEGAAVVFEEEESLSEARLQFVAGDYPSVSYAVFLEALLVGHEDWVTSLSWMPAGSSGHTRLFSTSMDRNMVVWAPDEAAGGIWIPEVRVGDIGGALGGSVGGNLLGFVGGCMSPVGDSIVGVGYGGSFHLWTNSQPLLKSESIASSNVTSSASESDSVEERWFPVPFLTGHFGSVNDIAWSPQDGSFLLSVSDDQTCRMFAPITKLNVEADVSYRVSSASSQESLWKEISRPQIHGYDLNCVVLLPHSYRAFTGGEEKLIRVFDAPSVVLQGTQQLCGIETHTSENISRISQAYIPELGLSNKAMESMSSQERVEQAARSVSVIDWRFHPLEGQLSDYTLWPEIKKMFGHSNDVVCMAMTADGQWVATANKARDTKTAHVLLWNASTMDLVARLPGHESTVVCAAFSPNNLLLATSGKDRALCLYKYQAAVAGDESAGTFQPFVQKKSVHKRIVWDCSWTSDSSKLLTVSRDGFCKVWTLVEGSTDLECIHTFSPFDGVAVTAVDVRGCAPSRGEHLVVFGAESGDLQISSLSAEGTSTQLLTRVQAKYSHGASVKRVKWRPTTSSSDEEVEFASCGEDNTLRVHRLVRNK